jgi:uncharacterized DUF497 family protein
VGTALYVVREKTIRLISVRIVRHTERETYESVRLAKFGPSQDAIDDR